MHVPFCAVRCGYCDFNTYTSAELGGGADLVAYAATATAELDLAAKVLDAAGLPARPAATVFFGGGTPTLLPAGDLAAMLGGVRDRFGLASGAEVTTEANPDSVTPQALDQLARGGVHAGVVRDAVRRAARARRARPHPRPGAGAAGRRVGAGRRARRQP